MNRNDWERLFTEAMNSLRQQVFVPFDTGNLKFNAIKGMWVDNNTYRIYIDEKVAPYVFFTEESWSKGQNPNEGWVEKAHSYLANYIAQRLKGSIKE